MATGATPAFESKVDDQNDETGALEARNAEPVTLGERIIARLSKIFEHGEHCGM